MKDFVKLEKDVQRYHELADNLINRVSLASILLQTIFKHSFHTCKVVAYMQQIHFSGRLYSFFKKSFTDMKQKLENVADFKIM